MERLHGIVSVKQANRRTTRRRTRNQDIRILYQRIACQQAQQQAAEQLRKTAEGVTSDMLQTENSTAPINATMRLRRLDTVRAIKARRESKHY